VTETAPARTAPPLLTHHPLHQHRTDAGGRLVIAIHLDEPGEPPEHTHPGYSPARPYDPGPVPPSAAANTINALRREQAERELAQARRTLAALTTEHERLARLAAALQAAVAEGWPLPPDCAAFADALDAPPVRPAEPA
jgi:hypothetical protein